MGYSQEVLLFCHVAVDVSDDSVSYEHLVKIYQGSKNTWSNGAPIIVFAIYEKDRTNEVLMGELPAFKEVLLDSFRNNCWQVFYNQQVQEQAPVKQNSFYWLHKYDSRARWFKGIVTIIL